jgi:hypothetical protein
MGCEGGWPSHEAERPGLVARFVMRGLGVNCFCLFIILQLDFFGGFPPHLFLVYL